MPRVFFRCMIVTCIKWKSIAFFFSITLPCVNSLCMWIFKRLIVWVRVWLIYNNTAVCTLYTQVYARAPLCLREYCDINIMRYRRHAFRAHWSETMETSLLWYTNHCSNRPIFIVSMVDLTNTCICETKSSSWFKIEFIYPL